MFHHGSQEPWIWSSTPCYRIRLGLLYPRILHRMLLVANGSFGSSALLRALLNGTKLGWWPRAFISSQELIMTKLTILWLSQLRYALCSPLLFLLASPFVRSTFKMPFFMVISQKMYLCLNLQDLNILCTPIMFVSYKKPSMAWSKPHGLGSHTLVLNCWNWDFMDLAQTHLFLSIKAGPWQCTFWFMLMIS